MTKKLKQFWHSSVPSYCIVGVLTLLGAGLRIFNSTKSSIWHDEGFSVMLASQNMVEIWQRSARDVHPPLYYELLHLSTQIFGTSVFSVRLLSILCGIALIPISYSIVRKISTKRAATITGLLVATSPFLVRYSQEARMYGLLTLLMALVLYSLIRIVQKPQSIWPYISYAVLIAAGMYTHYFTTLIVIAFWVYLLFLQPIKGISLGKSLVVTKKWWLANIAAFVLFIPWLPSMIEQLTRGQGLGWLSKTTLGTFHNTIWQFFTFTDGGTSPAAIYWVVPCIVVASVVVVLRYSKLQKRFGLLLVLYSFLPLVLALTLSFVRPVFHERYFVFAVPAVVAIIAIAIDTLAKKRYWLLAILLVPVVALQLVGIKNVYTQANHQMRQATSTLISTIQPGDRVIAGELYVFFDGAYYVGRQPRLYTGVRTPNGFGESSLLYDKQLYLPDYTAIPSGTRVWIIGKTGDQQYYRTIPTTWQLLAVSSAGYSEVRLYQVK